MKGGLQYSLKINAVEIRIFHNRGNSTMKSKRFGESQIFLVLNEVEVGIPVPELCRKHGNNSASMLTCRASGSSVDDSRVRSSGRFETRVELEDLGILQWHRYLEAGVRVGCIV